MALLIVFIAMGIMKRSVLLFCVFSALYYTRPACGQWTLIHTFTNANGTSSGINAVYFLDAVGLPSTGFVGTGSDIYRTNSGGTTWALVQSGLSGIATSFCFKNATLGWCSVGGSTNTPAIYETTDGGVTWAPLSVMGGGSCVSYNAVKGLLFLSTRLTGTNSFVSSDDGATWNPIAQTDENGFAFCDSLHGILSAHVLPFYRTSDGGSTWYDLGYVKHSWSPAAIPGTATFVAAEDLESNIYVSSDTGVTWSLASTVAGALTGCVQTGPCSVYVQSSDGIYYSSDASSWLPIPGGPGNTYDTRFYVGSNAIYAGDVSGDLFEHPALVGGWPQLSFSPQTLHVALAAGCAPKTDTVTFANFTCLPLTILSATLTDSMRWSYVPGQPLPLTLGTGRTVQFTITANNDTTGVFHDELQLWEQTSTGITDTIIVLDLNAVPLLAPSFNAPKVSLPDRCVSTNTVFSIRNNNCDTIHITSLTMLNTSLFHLTSINLPIAIPPDSECVIPLVVRPPKEGTFTDTVALVFTSNGFTLDTTLLLNGTVGTSAISERSARARWDSTLYYNANQNSIPFFSAMPHAIPSRSRRRCLAQLPSLLRILFLGGGSIRTIASPL